MIIFKKFDEPLTLHLAEDTKQKNLHITHDACGHINTRRYDHFSRCEYFRCEGCGQNVYTTAYLEKYKQDFIEHSLHCLEDYKGLITFVEVTDVLKRFASFKIEACGHINVKSKYSVTRLKTHDSTTCSVCKAVVHKPAIYEKIRADHIKEVNDLLEPFGGELELVVKDKMSLYRAEIKHKECGKSCIRSMQNIRRMKKTTCSHCNKIIRKQDPK